jgi:hypothetical protein
MRGQEFIIPVPRGGIRRDLTDAEVPLDALVDSRNVLFKFGHLGARPGLVRVRQTGVGQHVNGGFLFKNVAGSTRVVVATSTNWFKLDATTFTDITGTAVSADEDQHTRFVVFPTGGVNLLIGTNNTNTVKKWDGATATYLALGGIPYTAVRDMMILGNYLVVGNIIDGGVRYASRIAVSNFNDPETWSGIEADLTGNRDDIVAMRELTRTTGVIYKDESIWLASVQQGSFPIRLDRVETDIAGPVSPAVVVPVGRVHYYWGTDGRIYRFDGIQSTPMSSGVDEHIQEMWRATSKQRVFGFFDKTLRSVFFFFPVSSPDPDHAVSLDVDTGVLFLHSFADKIVAGWTGEDLPTVTWADLTPFTWANLAATYPTWDSFGGASRQASYLATDAGNVFLFALDQADDSKPIAFTWETPVRPWAGPRKRLRLDGVESSIQTIVSGPLVTVSAKVSEAQAEGVYSTSSYGTHDTSSTERQLLQQDVATTRFVGVKWELSSTMFREFRGALIYLWTEDEQ